MNDDKLQAEWEAYDFWSQVSILICGILAMGCMGLAWWAFYEAGGMM